MFLKNLFWAVSGSLSTILVNFVSIVILSRLLSPFEFGQLAIIMFFISVFNVIISGGLGGALIQLENISQHDYNSVFTLNFLMSILFFIILFLIAPHISNYYDDPSLTAMLRTTGIVLILNCFQLIGITKLVRDLRFKLKTLAQAIALVLASTIAIIAAYYDLGTWSLVILQIANSLFAVIFINVVSPVVYRLEMNKTSIKKVLPFGANTTASSILTTTFDEFYSLIIGRLFGLKEVGLYYQGKRIQLVLVNLFNSLSQGVVYSSLVKSKSNIEKFKSDYDKIIIGFNVIIGVLIIVLYINAENIISILLGDQWMGSIFYLRVLVFASFFLIQDFFNRIIFKSFDQTSYILKLEFVKKIFQGISIVVGIYFSDIRYLLLGLIISYFFSFLISNHYSHRILMKSSKKNLFKIMIIFCGASSIAITSSLITLESNILIEALITGLGILLYSIYLFAFKVINMTHVNYGIIFVRTKFFKQSSS